MRLYLHIGTEKTGSSFLQSYLANHRDLLNKHKIYYPKAGMHESNALKGIITPGNASDLNKALETESWAVLKKWLHKKYKETKSNACHTLLLSNEILSITLANNKVLNKFKAILDDIGFDLQPMLLIIREPVSQALSLYKHRSKQGQMLPIEEWLDKNYILADALSAFYKSIESNNLALCQYLYKKDSKYLVDVCINKWLKLSEDIKVAHQSVNPSLTLSELSLLSELHQKDTHLSSLFHKKMSALEASKKSDDQLYKSFVVKHINNYMYGYNKLWETVGAYMSVKDKPFVYQKIENLEDNYTATFSKAQVGAIADFIKYAQSGAYRQNKFVIKLKQMIIKITPPFIIKLRHQLKN